MRELLRKKTVYNKSVIKLHSSFQDRPARVFLLVHAKKYSGNGESTPLHTMLIVSKTPRFCHHLERISRTFYAGSSPRLPRVPLARAAWPHYLVFTARESPPRPWRRRRHDDGGGRDSLGAVAPPP